MMYFLFNTPFTWLRIFRPSLKADKTLKVPLWSLRIWTLHAQLLVTWASSLRIQSISQLYEPEHYLDLTSCLVDLCDEGAGLKLISIPIKVKHWGCVFMPDKWARVGELSGGCSTREVLRLDQTIKCSGEELCGEKGGTRLLKALAKLLLVLPNSRSETLPEWPKHD